MPAPHIDPEPGAAEAPVDENGSAAAAAARVYLSGHEADEARHDLDTEHDGGVPRTGPLESPGGSPAAPAATRLPVGGVHAWRRDGEHHQWNPETIATVQHAVRYG